MGSKNRIAKHILPIMLSEATKRGYTEGSTWIEPFNGGGNMIDKVPPSYHRIGYDLNPHAVAALIAVRDHVNELPSNVSQEEYYALKGTPAKPIESWIRFVCSYGGKFENGYARQGNNERYRSTPCEEGKRNAIKQSPNLQGVELRHCCYSEIDVRGCIIYSDPPYQGATAYKTAKFDSNKFFDWCRSMKSRGNLVFVSEYNAPEDFTELWRGEVKTNFSSQRTTATHNAVEKLFIV